jgi:hypothetical protein
MLYREVYYKEVMVSLVPRLPHVFSVALRKRREPCKVYHVRDVGIEANDYILSDGNHVTVNDR